MQRTLLIIAVVFAISGCATTSQTVQNEETQKDVSSAIQSVVGAISGQEVDEEKLKKLVKEIENDEEAQKAVEALTNSMGGNVVVKYCPLDGKRYSADLEFCPGTDVPLKIVE